MISFYWDKTVKRRVQDVVYHEYVEEMRSVYIERQREFEMLLTDQIIPFFKSLKMTLSRITEGDKEYFDNIFDDMDFDLHEMNSYLTTMLNR